MHINYKMNICINVFGKQHLIETLKKTLNENIIDSENKFHILYTGWDDEEPIFENMFPNSYVIRINKNQELIKNYLNKYENITIDATNPYKSLEHVLYGLYIKKKSTETIEKYMLEKNINFDLIVTIRTYSIIFYNYKLEYDKIKSIGLDKVFIPKGRSFDIYNVGSCTDTITIANVKNTFNIFNQIDYIDKTIIPNTNFIHPETSYYLYLKYLGLELFELNFIAFCYHFVNGNIIYYNEYDKMINFIP